MGRIRRARFTDVDVQGTMRLASGLAIGVQLSEVAGFNVTRMAHDGEWSSHGLRGPANIERQLVEIGQGDELAVAMAVSQPNRRRRRRVHLGQRAPHQHARGVYSPLGGANRQAVENPEAGLALAGAISSALRDDTRDRPA